VDRGAGHLEGRKRGVTTATASILPRAEETSTVSPFRIFFSFARSSPISTNCRGCSSRSHGRSGRGPRSANAPSPGTSWRRTGTGCRTSRTHPPAAPRRRTSSRRVRPLLRHQVLLDGALERLVMLGERAVLEARPEDRCHASARMMYGFFPSFSSPIGGHGPSGTSPSTCRASRRAGRRSRSSR